MMGVFLFLFILNSVAYANSGTICLSLKSGNKEYCARTWRDKNCPKGTVEFHRHSCVLAGELLPSIQQLASGDVISEIEYKNHSPTEIALSLVSRIQQEEVRGVANKSKHLQIDIFGESEIIMAAPQKHIHSILKKGFLNFHQTAHTEGANDANERSQIEDLMIGIKLEKSYKLSAYINTINQIRPKYAFLQFKSTIKNELPSNSIIDQYGGIFFSFNTNIKRRSTFTVDDSLCYSCLYKNERVGNRSFSSSLRMENFNRMRGGNSVFFEAQIWGPLDKSDVNYVLVNCGEIAFQKFEQTHIKTINEIKSSGIQVYQCIPELDPRTGYVSRLTKGKKL